MKAEWCERHGRCWVCGWSRGKRWPHKGWLPKLELHHILGGANRSRSDVPAGWFRVCQWCHQEVVPGMGLAEQLAYKYRHDRKEYNRQLLLSIRNPNAPNAVTREDVVVFLEKLDGARNNR